MISSMTGYAVGTKELAKDSLSLELRSINYRYLDLQFRLPDEFRMLEPMMRELLTAKLSRGKIECRLRISSLTCTVNTQQINSDLLEKLIDFNHIVTAKLPTAQSLSVVDVLNWPGMLENDAPSADDLRNISIELLLDVLSEFSATREHEGEKLKIILLERLKQMRQLVKTALPRIPALLEAFQEKLKSRLQGAEINPEDDRIRQELSLFANKIDVDEELTRLQTHLDEVERILCKGGAVGKRLDFFMQELNREANTIGSKSIDMEISKISLALKTLIEQMREQVQNIE